MTALSIPVTRYGGSLESTITIGVSACLLGHGVRFDGGHKHDRYITDTLGRFFRFLSVCPEDECGMGTPREAMHLEGDPLSPRLVTIRSRADKTSQMLDYCGTKVIALEKENLCGFIFKSNSPSSGLHRVKVYSESGLPAKSGTGLFAAAFVARFPHLPAEEEGRLNDPMLREHFIERVFAFARWRDFLSASPCLGLLVDFHTRHKLQIMAHSPAIYREMGVLVAHGASLDSAELMKRYESLFMKGLAFQATAAKNTNVLDHIMGYFKNLLGPPEKAELLEAIGQYHDRIVPLAVPVTLLKHYISKYENDYLGCQTYLSPFPAELMLRNHI